MFWLKITKLSAIVFGSLLAAIVSPANGQPAAPLISTVYTVNYPLQYFAARIAGDRARVVFPGPTDADPAFWRPSAAHITEYQNADLILLNGARYARWRALASLPRSRQVDTSATFRDALIRGASAVAHRHGPTGAHDHGGIAFTTWLDLRQAALQARAVRDGLARLVPDAEKTFESNFAILERELLELDSAIAEVSRRDPDRSWLASHPVYQYLARRYDLEIRALSWEPDTVPNGSEWAALEQLLAHDPSRWMLWEREPLPETTDRLATMGIQVVVFDPCANVPGSGDFMRVMRDNVVNLRRAYE